MAADNGAEFLPAQPTIDFEKVARQFTSRALGRQEIEPTYIDQIANGLRRTDESLKDSRGEIIFLNFYNRDVSTYGVGRTNGQGLRIVNNPRTNEDQIAFGKDGVMLVDTSVGGSYQHRMIQSGSLVIPEGFPLEFLTRRGGIEFVMGDEEIIRFLKHSGLSQTGWTAFMFEQIGIDTPTFLDRYVKPPTPALPNSANPAQFQRDLERDLEGYRARYKKGIESSEPRKELEERSDIIPSVVIKGDE